MPEPKIIVVAGATGAQGGGLVRAIQADPACGFRARALTRDPASPKAQALAALGAEVVAADLDDATSLDAAFKGAYGAYCVTFFWDHFSPEREQAQARAMAQAAARAGLRHVIWSTLEDSRRFIPLTDTRMPTLQGRYKVPHFDAKGESDRWFEQSGLPVTYLLTSFYWENFIHFGMGPQRMPDGRLALTAPLGHGPFPGIATEDIGRCALGIFARGNEYHGRRVGIAGEHLTGEQMAAAMGRAAGVEILYNSITPEAYRKLGFPGADDLGNMFQFNTEFGEMFCGARDPAVARALNPQLQDFATWLRTNVARIPMPA